MVDGVTQKLITVTDGVSYPVISSTTYPITYKGTGHICRKVVFYSDNTMRVIYHQQTKHVQNYQLLQPFQMFLVFNIHLRVLQKLIYIINHKPSFHI